MCGTSRSRATGRSRYGRRARFSTARADRASAGPSPHGTLKPALAKAGRISVRRPTADAGRYRSRPSRGRLFRISRAKRERRHRNRVGPHLAGSRGRGAGGSAPAESGPRGGGEPESSPTGLRLRRGTACRTRTGPGPAHRARLHNLALAGIFAHRREAKSLAETRRRLPWNRSEALAAPTLRSRHAAEPSPGADRPDRCHTPKPGCPRDQHRACNAPGTVPQTPHTTRTGRFSLPSSNVRRIPGAWERPASKARAPRSPSGKPYPPDYRTPAGARVVVHAGIAAEDHLAG